MGVIAIIMTLTALAVPAVTANRNAGDITKATYDVAGVLENARAYATANNTYVWVGLYEEDAAQGATAPTATSGTGRIVLSTVASKDGTNIYNKSSFSTGTTTALAPTSLIQVGKLVKIENAHLKTASVGDTLFPLGDGTGESFATRPTVNATEAQFGDTSPPAASCALSFSYPVGYAATAQYTFSKVLQITPRGEACFLKTYPFYCKYEIAPVLEIGLQPARGTVVNAKNPNIAAIQITGILGNVKIYRR